VRAVGTGPSDWMQASAAACSTSTRLGYAKASEWVRGVTGGARCSTTEAAVVVPLKAKGKHELLLAEPVS
jgi:hypothetical protein